ncbi:MAG: tetratricopeptide repeat protein [Gammaproteobacteria bacterium]|nr:tetratricopeptide repeat protein [Gammaproteobacteria bacterium]MBU1442623.1 tetratricopeptide repeat protein [Gammaproteobacteria bacterium]MBU2288645.1 tetratricopeptide repeat protein [Gammaproteobacteria bacterium]MBU2409144.1 tetratricopeptide repeat protein [Gammaproteobacteria bacterium]
MQDLLGNPLTLDSPASLPAVDAFIDGFLSCEARAADVLLAQDDSSPMVQAYCAAVHLFGESRDAAAKAMPHIERAVKGAINRATDRENRFISAVMAWARGDISRAIEHHQAAVRENPRDLVAVKLGQYHCFNVGDAPGMLRLALVALPAAADICYTHGMLAFGYEQCNMLREAETSARRAIEMRRKEPWAHHALSHVMLTEGRLTEGLRFMQDVSETWTGLNSFMYTHNWWHVALFLIDLDRHEEALAIYDDKAWGIAKEYSQDQIGAVSLLARLELAGVNVGARWQELADHLVTRVEDHILPFLDLQYLYGLARAGRPEAEQLLLGIHAFADDEPPSMRGAWQSVAVPAAKGLYAHAKGNHAEAARQLGIVLPRLQEIGGSHAQRDLFQQVYIDALLRTGTPETLANASLILSKQVAGQPESLRLRRQLLSATQVTTN